MKRAGLLLLILSLVFCGCKSTKKKPEEKPSDKPAATAAQESSDVDFQAFIGRLRQAAASRDMHAMAAMMTPNFGYSLEPELSGDGVFQYWDEHGLWPELQGILSEKFVTKDDFMVAPPQFANPTVAYDGYRAGIRRVNGSWKFVYFVNG